MVCTLASQSCSHTANNTPTPFIIDWKGTFSMCTLARTHSTVMYFSGTGGGGGGLFLVLL